LTACLQKADSSPEQNSLCSLFYPIAASLCGSLDAPSARVGIGTNPIFRISRTTRPQRAAFYTKSAPQYQRL